MKEIDVANYKELIIMIEHREKRRISALNLAEDKEDGDDNQC